MVRNRSFLRPRRPIFRYNGCSLLGFVVQKYVKSCKGSRLIRSHTKLIETFVLMSIEALWHTVAELISLSAWGVALQEF